ncbi:MAG: exo-alpha-sialidase [Lentisphaeria bacterium]|nr:exo-alpha-sialidase [Lentisphaeria bacterium]
MCIEKFVISRDPAFYEAWPDVALTRSGRLVTVFTECIHHSDRSYTRIMLTESDDRGRTWSQKHPLTEGTAGLPYSYNCARISLLKDGRLVIIVDWVPASGENDSDQAVNVLYFSSDEGNSWSEAVITPLCGIVPDKVLELDNGRWLIAAHRPYYSHLAQYCRYSDDQGATWSDEITVAQDSRYNLCEVSMLPLGDGKIVAFMRENSGLGNDCMKCISHDNGESWSALINFPLPGCHRPASGMLAYGKIFITYRFMQGGKGWLGAWTQNFFGALTDVESALAIRRNDSHTRIIPIDYDRSVKSDLGYSGWVQFPDGEIYIVNYIADDAFDKCQIRGYSMRMENFIISENNEVNL